MDKTEKHLFIEAVYQIVRTIPEGRATSYAAIAKAVGYPALFRMVGSIMANSGLENDNVPAHRVVNSRGVLSGRFAFGSGREMQKLLEAEGVCIANNKIKNWKTVFWSPIDEINL